MLLVPGAIVSEATLSFLGFGDPRVPTWGRMLQNAKSFGAFAELAWWWILPPGLALTILAMAFVFIGNTLDDILNRRNERGVRAAVGRARGASRERGRWIACELVVKTCKCITTAKGRCGPWTNQLHSGAGTRPGRGGRIGLRQVQPRA